MCGRLVLNLENNGSDTMNDNPIYENVENPTPIYNRAMSDRSRDRAAAVVAEYYKTIEPAPVEQLPDSLVPPVARTIGYVAIAVWSVFTPVVLGVQPLLDASASAILTHVYLIVGGVIGSYAGVVGIANRPTR